MQVFHITLEGPDSDYGSLGHEHVTVTFKETFIWDEEMIQQAKEMLAEFYDCSVKQILTDDDVKKEEAELTKYLDEEQKRLS